MKNVYINIPNSRVRPTNTDELRDIVHDTIKRDGISCDLNFIDTSLITDMSWLFTWTGFRGDISKWNTSNVTSMAHMFAYSSTQFTPVSVEEAVPDSDSSYVFNCDLSDWDVSKVKNMFYMFADSNFDGDISSWNVAGVTNMTGIFRGAIKFNQRVWEWDRWISNHRFIPPCFIDSGVWETLKEWGMESSFKRK